MEDSRKTEGLEIEKQLAELKEWVSTQLHIPKDMGDKMLLRFLHSCYYDMEKAKKTIEVFTSIRATAPELFTNRDPLSPHIQEAFKFANLALIRMSDNRNLSIFQLNDPGLKNFDHLEFTRSILIALDAWFLEQDYLEDSVVSIMDAKDIGWRIFWKLNMSVAKNMAKYQEEALPLRIKQMHMINAPPLMDKLFSILKQFMSKEMSELVHFHAPNSETLFQYISKDELPSDLGGNLDSLEEYNKKVVDLLLKHRETLMRDDLWRAPSKKT